MNNNSDLSGNGNALLGGNITPTAFRFIALLNLSCLLRVPFDVIVCIALQRVAVAIPGLGNTMFSEKLFLWL